MTTLYTVQNDNKAVRSVVLYNGPSSSSSPINLTTATAVQLNASGPVSFTKACTFVADASGSVSITLLAADLATAGTYQIEWQVTFADGTVATWPDGNAPTNSADTLIIRQQLA